MVCKSCEKKMTKVAAPDPFRHQGSSSSSAAGPSRKPLTAEVGRKVGENKLLSNRNRYNPVGSKCIICKQTVTQERAKYCQGCAYKKGVCAICGKMILDTKGYKQSSK